MTGASCAGCPCFVFCAAAGSYTASATRLLLRLCALGYCWVQAGLLHVTFIRAGASPVFCDTGCKPRPSWMAHLPTKHLYKVLKTIVHGQTCCVAVASSCCCCTACCSRPFGVSQADKAYLHRAGPSWLLLWLTWHLCSRAEVPLCICATYCCELRFAHLAGSR